jgi:tRNA modification GTPase
MQTSAANDIIAALSTAQGQAALSVVRMSGAGCVELLDTCFSRDLANAQGYSLHFGRIMNGEELVDEVVVSVFRNPHSYTGEDLVEISCHGSPYIVSELLELLFRKGARPAREGEFTLRAFLAGKLDLSQAEAVADLIASESRNQHKLALQQLRGGYSKELQSLRQALIDYVALIELELDFGEEDVEFADRDGLTKLLRSIHGRVQELCASFRSGNAIRQGIPVVIAGKPNAGKSTLLNALLKEERAIVSDIAGTTRDTIEERFVLNGSVFRLIDTAGLREGADQIETLGIERSHAQIRQAAVVLYLFDVGQTTPEGLQEELAALPDSEAWVIPVGNKCDLYPDAVDGFGSVRDFTPVSAARMELSNLLEKLAQVPAAQMASGNSLMVTNVRHLHALQSAGEGLAAALDGLESGLSGELLAFHLRVAIREIGSITGIIDNEEVLGSIFSRFCIGK